MLQRSCYHLESEKSAMFFNCFSCVLTIPHGIATTVAITAEECHFYLQSRSSYLQSDPDLISIKVSVLPNL